MNIEDKSFLVNLIFNIYLTKFIFYDIILPLQKH